MGFSFVKCGGVAVIVTVGLLSAATQASASPILLHQYQLNGTYADDLAGPALVSNGGTLGPSGYTFGANQGLMLSNAISQTDYSIVLDFSISSTSGYRKLVDFKNLTVDPGLYNNGTSLHFYNPVPAGPSGQILSNTQVQVALTRDGGTQAVSGYVNGALQFGFVDTGSLATFTGPNNIINFFIDDFVNGGEASAGFVDDIRIYDGALTAADVAGLGQAVDIQSVPEPGTMLLLATGLVACVRRVRQRQTR